MKKLLVQGVEDIHVDPHLNDACARDIRSFYRDMPNYGGTGTYKPVVLCGTKKKEKRRYIFVEI